MRNKQRYNGISQSIDSGGVNTARGLIKSQQSSIDRSSIQLKHQLNQALFESLRSGASQDDGTIIEKTVTKLDLHGKTQDNTQRDKYGSPLQSQQVLKTVNALTAKRTKVPIAFVNDT